MATVVKTRLDDLSGMMRVKVDEVFKTLTKSDVGIVAVAMNSFVEHTLLELEHIAKGVVPKQTKTMRDSIRIEGDELIADATGRETEQKMRVGMSDDQFHAARRNIINKYYDGDKGQYLRDLDNSYADILPARGESLLPIEGGNTFIQKAIDIFVKSPTMRLTSAAMMQLDKMSMGVPFSKLVDRELKGQLEEISEQEVARQRVLGGMRLARHIQRARDKRTGKLTYRGE